MKEIGGYFEIELPKSNEYHKNLIRLSSGRNAFEYILLANKYTKVFIPYFTCEAILETIIKLKLDYEYYNINENFFPIFNFNIIRVNEVFLYTNYFGICDNQVANVKMKCKNLIIDNVQAFFSKPIPNTDTFYSPRKFFGVPDGAYLYSKKKLNSSFEKEVTNARSNHLIKRLELSASEGYDDYKKNEELFKNDPIKEISVISQKLLSSIKYDYVIKKRRSNFKLLNKNLKTINKMDISIESKEVPMVYPFWTKKRNLRQKLLENNIYTAIYWPNVLKWADKNSYEYLMTKEIIYLPIDQRYGSLEMKKIIELIINFLK